MQRVLTFKVGNKKYISKPWDFEALCRVQEEHIKKETDSIGRIAGGAVDYLFEGTEATQDILNAATVEKMRMCREVFGWYLADMGAIAGKNDAAAPTEETAEA